MRRPVLKFAALAVAVYLAALVTLFPASLAIRWFVPAVPGLVLGPADGTIWQGRVAGVEYLGWNPGPVEWNLQALPLLGLAAVADIRVLRDDGAPLLGTLRATPDGSLQVSGLQGALALVELEKAGVIPRNIARGDIILDIGHLDLENGLPVAASGRVGLTGLQSTFLPGIALGSYEGEIESVTDGIRATFHDVEAPLRIAGQLQLQRDGRYTVNGSITPTAETPETVRRGLAFLGSPNASGSYEFSFGGTLN